MMPNRNSFLCRIIAAALCPYWLWSTPASAAKSYIIDGDTFVQNGVTYRIWGIDAPELSQVCQNPSAHPYPCGRLAKGFLQNLITGHELNCQEMPHAKYETRLVARCFIDNEDIGQLMIRAGWAIEYEYFSQGFYSQDEAEAQNDRRGLWSGTFQMPREWRKEHKKSH